MNQYSQLRGRTTNWERHCVYVLGYKGFHEIPPDQMEDSIKLYILGITHTPQCINIL